MSVEPGECTARTMSTWAARLGSLKSALPVLKNPFNRNCAVTLTLDQFKYGWANALDDEQEVLLKGLSVSAIREQSLHYWAQGFAQDPSEEMFLTLLEELIGLGIFRRVQGNRFTLRNANMLLLVGSQDQVLDELKRERELPPGYDAATFRSSFTTDPGDRSGPARRSPITAKQESDLRTSGHGVTIGPILLGAAAPAHILTPSATVRRVVNMTALAVADVNAVR